MDRWGCGVWREGGNSFGEVCRVVSVESGLEEGLVRRVIGVYHRGLEDYLRRGYRVVLPGLGVMFAYYRDTYGGTQRRRWGVEFRCRKELGEQVELGWGKELEGLGVMEHIGRMGRVNKYKRKIWGIR